MCKLPFCCLQLNLNPLFLFLHMESMLRRQS